METVFSKIIAGDIPAKILKETEHSLAFLDAFPLTKGHTLVIPKNPREKIQDLTDEENKDLFSLVHIMASKIDSISGATLIAIHNGKEAGQEIPHVHVHIIPRSSSDGAGPIHSMFNSSKLSELEIEEIYNKLKD
ncbi:HIT family protein [Nitrosopumilus sp.]|uniref:HIT family protein n=1 Tax=Nitrosopumilus sp. TaxID=2024843 RepID=UPI002622D483|nr:HIT family protein [Nitrosopumilus sp.]